MSVFKNFDGNELVVSCKCGCDEGIHFEINGSEDDDYAFVTFTNGNFYTEQKCPFIEKLKKIWAIIWNKDYYYSDIVMTRKDFEQFRKWVNTR